MTKPANAVVPYAPQETPINTLPLGNWNSVVVHTPLAFRRTTVPVLLSPRHIRHREQPCRIFNVPQNKKDSFRLRFHECQLMDRKSTPKRKT